ncbi:MAG: TIGR00153 family protein [Candidatus Thioglobus sp.]|jgi:predicted phosphate transport protein (TIGR00153 family)|nr:TIGR00153 family protein [Candidatus Pseudothioglobus aerophilus]MBT3439933.1 TIGR00153 family protein [Gammaproteobacteria bacterium]MBT4245055.1 TIGR00153 family protein [Gammaproteobacteria bacterium]MBT4587007.1 TIGR00153 family protein [Gammaproteobacteria bacterium]MBT5547606.1 TIGR00153 family protein [Gammaproteobacteria bacterium]
MTKSGNITSLFGKSPISPLQKHMKQVHSCIKEFGVFAKAAKSEDWEKAQEAQVSIGNKEKKADQLKKKLRMNLPSTFMMPFSRRDLLDVLLIQDSIANITKDLAGLMMTRHMVFPKEFAEDFINLAELCIKTSGAALVAINELDELLETAFSSRERKIVAEMVKKINVLEHDTDTAQNDIRNKLFLLESNLPPVDVMFYYRAIEWLGETADAAQKVGSRFEVMLTK